MKQVLFAVLIAVVAGYVGSMSGKPVTSSVQESDTVLARVLKTGILRCGYASWQPMLIIDPNTKEISGAAHDIMEEAAKKIGVKVEWTEEAGWGEFTQGLNNNRFDVFCTGHWPTVSRARVVDFTEPFLFSPLNIYARVDDRRFDRRIDLLNNEKAKMVYIDGSTASGLIAAHFPQAKKITLPELTPFSNIFMEIAYKKADATIIDPATAADFMKSNPGVLKIIPGGEGYRVYPHIFSVKKGEYQLQKILNVTLQELAREGVIEKIIKKYETMPGTYYRMVNPYQMPAEGKGQE